MIYDNSRQQSGREKEYSVEQTKAANKGFFARLKQGLSKTREGFIGRIVAAVSGKNKLDRELLDEIEEILIESDIGAARAYRFIEEVKQQASESGNNGGQVLETLKKEILNILSGESAEIASAGHGALTVIMFVGVNGTGKTTTIGKLAAKYRSQGKKVMIAAADTFRAAAIEQVQIWGERAGAVVISHEAGGDPAAVAFDAVEAGKARGMDYLLIDTAGRLHTNVNLMEELKKVKRVVGKALPGAPHEVLLVLDATTGQNAISQARTFAEGVGVTGIVLTKLDGTAKGGIVVAIKDELGVPVKLVGVGEGIEDLRPFDPVMFVEALFDQSDTVAMLDNGGNRY